MIPFVAAGGLVVGAGLILREAWRRYAVEAARGPLSQADRLAAFAKYPGSFCATMNAREAQLILAVSTWSSKESIVQAHRELMKANHPDYGGSDYVATKINEAKDVLLKGVGQQPPPPNAS